MVGENEASKIYVSQKEKACSEIGIKTKNYFFPTETNEIEVIDLIKELNADKEVNGILVQLPLPEKINEFNVMNSINPLKDVDGFHPLNLGRLFQGKPLFVPCTVKAVMLAVKSTGVRLEAKNAVVVGTSNIVGKPLGIALLEENCSVRFCNKYTQNLSEKTKKADILCVAVGKPGLISGEMVKEGSICIDVGISRLENGKIFGDIVFKEAQKKAGFISPVPGGIGPLTVAMLLENTLQAAKLQSKGEGK